MSQNILAMAYNDYRQGLISFDDLTSIREGLSSGNTPKGNTPKGNTVSGIEIWVGRKSDDIVSLGTVSGFKANGSVRFQDRYRLTAIAVLNGYITSEHKPDNYNDRIWLARDSNGHFIKRKGGKNYWHMTLSKLQTAKSQGLPNPYNDPHGAIKAMEKHDWFKTDRQDRNVVSNIKPVENTTIEPDPVNYTLSIDVPAPPTMTVDNDDKRSSLTVWLQDTIPALVSDKWIEYGFSADEQARLARSAKARLVAHGHTLPDGWLDRKYAFLIDQAVKAKLITLTK